MKTTITVKANVFTVNFGGIGISIDTQNILQSIETLEQFYHTVIPESKKETLKGSGVEEIFENSRKYRPFLQRFIDCFELKGDAESVLTIHTNGMISIEGTQDTRSTASINFKGIMQLFSDVSDFIEAEQEARSKKREQEKVATRTNILLPVGSTYQQLLDLLEEHNIYNVEVNHYLRQGDDSCQVTSKAVDYVNYTFDLNDDNVNIELTAPDRLDIQEGISRVDFHRTLKSNKLIDAYPVAPQPSRAQQWLTQSMTSEMIYSEAAQLGISCTQIKVLVTESVTDLPLGFNMKESVISYNGTPRHEEETE